MCKIKSSTSKKEILEMTPACQCDKCSHGCTMGSGFCAEDDVKKIAKFLKCTEDELKEKYLEEQDMCNKTLFRPKIERKGKPYGKCVFYDKEKGCTIHKVKPLQCKISMGCKPYGDDLYAWFLLNHIVDKKDPQSVSQYKAYIDAGGKIIPGGEVETIIQKE